MHTSFRKLATYAGLTVVGARFCAAFSFALISLTVAASPGSSQTFLTSLEQLEEQEHKALTARIQAVNINPFRNLPDLNPAAELPRLQVVARDYAALADEAEALIARQALRREVQGGAASTEENRRAQEIWRAIGALAAAQRAHSQAMQRYLNWAQGYVAGAQKDVLSETTYCEPMREHYGAIMSLGLETMKAALSLHAARTRHLL